MLDIQNVCKSISNKSIIRDINIQINAGNIYGLIGPNGSGKTTLIKCITGIYKSDTGHIRFNDEDVFDNNSIKEKIGYVADFNHYYATYTINDIIKFYSNSYSAFDMEKFDTLNNVFGLNKKMLIRNLSKGMKTKLAIMLSLSIQPALLILDEPTSGLDPASRRELLDMLLKEVCERNIAVLIASHNLNELERVCDVIGIIEEGSIKYTNTLDEMKRQIKKFQIVLKENASFDFNTLDGVIRCEKKGRVYYIVTERFDDKLKSTFEELDIHFMEEVDLSLEDMFIYSTGGAKYV